MQYIKGFKLANKEYKIQGELLLDIKKLNILIGVNNSGKSRFMRSMFLSTLDDFLFFLDYNEDLKTIYKELKEKYGTDLFFLVDLAKLLESNTGDYVRKYNEFYERVQAFNTRKRGEGHIWDLDVANDIKIKLDRYNLHAYNIGEYSLDFRFVYIPIIRGLRHIDLSEDSSGNKMRDLYKLRTENDYNFNEDSRYNENAKETFTGLSIYSEIKKMLLGDKKDRKFIDTFEKFLSKSFFDEKQITLIPDHDRDHIKIDIGNQEDFREIYNVGDGIQSIIIATFKAFQYKDQQTILFLEEPDLTMHPSAQRVLIEVLIKEFPNLQVFLTTHSNHFLDLSYDYPGDVSIFSFEKDKEKEEFTIKNLNDNTEILNLLGIRNSSVFLSNCVLWTEGVTDRMFLRKLISLDPIFNFKEDFHYAFAEYGGANLENFDFAATSGSESNKVQVNKSINRRNMIIIDNDLAKQDSEKYKRRKNIRKVMGNDHVFDGHVEIENLIPFKIWVKVVEKLLLEKPSKSIKIRDEFMKNENHFNTFLVKTKIGKLIKQYIIGIVSKDYVPQYFDSDSITCLGEDKKYIMQKVIEVIDEEKISLEDFPKLTIGLLEQMKLFISRSNK